MLYLVPPSLCPVVLTRFFCPLQPALLYLVPACVGFPVVVALLKGELTEMFRSVLYQVLLGFKQVLDGFQTNNTGLNSKDSSKPVTETGTRLRPGPGPVPL